MDGAVSDLPTLEAVTDSLWGRAAEALTGLYGDGPGFEAWLGALRASVDAAAAVRPDVLKAWDRDNPRWWLAQSTLGYSAYVDRLGEDFSGVAEALTYLDGLGVSYLHLLPLMKPRAGESDGGYAIADFEDVNPAFGTRAEFAHLLDAARARGINVVIDLVCNHVADDHAWAKAAQAGDASAKAFFHVFSERADVDQWEDTLDDVFPLSAPGNFTWSEDLNAWVWTSFYPYQWDLNYANRDVFLAMTRTLLNLANQGVSGFRLDSTGFLWKRLGTTCRNLPEVHQILAAWRAILSIAAPGVVLKAEAIDRLEEVLPYFGTNLRPECDLAYANGVMAGAWASLAFGQAGPVRDQIARAATRPDGGAWINYVRCHDDIILGAIRDDLDRDDQIRAATILTGGEPGRFGDGEVFQTFDGVPSINGMTASLCGVPEDPWGVARHVMMYGVCLALDGVPVIYMGDEFGLANDRTYRNDPVRAKEGRWLQRPAMDWPVAQGALQGEGGSRPVAVASAIATLIRQRRRHPAFLDLSPTRLLPGQPDAVLGVGRGDRRESLLILANFSAAPAIGRREEEGDWKDIVSGREGVGRDVPLAPYEMLWIEAV